MHGTMISNILTWEQREHVTTGVEFHHTEKGQKKKKISEEELLKVKGLYLTSLVSSVEMWWVVSKILMSSIFIPTPSSF